MIRLLTILFLSCVSLHAAIPPMFFRHTGTNVVVPPSSDCSTNPYVYYTFDQGGAEQGNESILNKDLTNGPVTVTTITGVISNGVSFVEEPGNNGMFRADSDLEFSGTAVGFTVRYWFRTSVALNTTRTVGRSDTGFQGWRLVSQSGRAQFRVSHGSGTLTVTESTIPIDDGNWHHILGWWDKVGQQIGVSVDSVTNVLAYTQTMAATSEPLVVNGSAANGEFDIDELCIWKDCVLTQNQRLADYNSDFGTTIPFTATRILDPEGGHLADPEDGSLINDPGT